MGNNNNLMNFMNFNNQNVPNFYNNVLGNENTNMNQNLMFLNDIG